MNIEGVIWLRDIVDKLTHKHHVETYEVEEALENDPKIRFVEKGERAGEDVYLALGQTDDGRYLAVLFIYKLTREALIMSARDMATRSVNTMAKNKTKPMPKQRSLHETVEFFETHDMGDYLDAMPEAHFGINLKRRTHVIALDEDLADKVAAIARAKHVPSQMLINKWV